MFGVLHVAITHNKKVGDKFLDNSKLKLAAIKQQSHNNKH